MQDPPSIAWLLLALTCLVGCLALIPGVRRGWRWGRTDTSIPMTGVGAALIVLVARFRVIARREVQRL